MTLPSVLFIVGKGRSGTTIVGDILGSFDDTFHMGEVWRIWGDGLSGRHTCSCGATVPKCPVWGAVVGLVRERGFSWAVEDGQTTRQLQGDLYSFAGVATARLLGRYARSLETYTGLTRALYEAVGEVTGVPHLIDSSKWPLDPTIVSRDRSIDHAILHLVRHPASVARSWATPKPFPDADGYMPRYGSIHTALSWASRVIAAEHVVKRAGRNGLTVRFEDFTRNPEQWTGEISRVFLGAPRALPISERREIPIESGHTIMGNPVRFRSGPVQLREESPPPRNGVVGLMTWPIRRRFGY